MNTHTTALENPEYIIEHLFQVQMKIYKTYGSEDFIFYDSIGAKSNDIISSTYGKYASFTSLLDALLEERAKEKKYDL